MSFGWGLSAERMTALPDTRRSGRKCRILEAALDGIVDYLDGGADCVVPP